MATDDLRSERLRKLESMRQTGVDPYPAESNRTHDNITFLASFEELSDAKQVVTLGGRIMSLRDQGGLVFIDLFDGTERVQVLIKKDEIGNQEFEV